MSGIRDFAKIVTASDGRQVLFYVDPNGGDYVLNRIANFDGLQANIKLEFGNPDSDVNEHLAFTALDAISLEDADRFIASIEKLLADES